MPRMTKRRQAAIDRLAQAVTYYQERAPGVREQARVIEEIRYRFNISPKTMQTALRMLHGMSH